MVEGLRDSFLNNELLSDLW